MSTPSVQALLVATAQMSSTQALSTHSSSAAQVSPVGSRQKVSAVAPGVV
jgi:hypothetical protein